MLTSLANWAESNEHWDVTVSLLFNTLFNLLRHLLIKVDLVEGHLKETYLSAAPDNRISPFCHQLHTLK